MERLTTRKTWQALDWTRNELHHSLDAYSWLNGWPDTEQERSRLNAYTSALKQVQKSLKRQLRKQGYFVY